MPRFSPKQFVIALSCVLSLPAQQSRPSIPSSPLNLDFSVPLNMTDSAWQVYPGSVALGYTAAIRRDGCRIAPQCGALIAPDVPKRANATGNLLQRFDAAPYRDKIVKVTAWLRADSPDSSAYSF